jgi:hypothetical protein
MMNLLDTDRSILFLRVPKCGSTYVRQKMIEITSGKKELIHAYQNHDEISWLDFRRPQLESLVQKKNIFVATEYFSPLGTTYNRYRDWFPEQAKSAEEARDLFDEFKKENWFVFSFIRHPGDLLCSMYSYGTDSASTNRWYYKDSSGQIDKNFYWYDPNESMDDFIGRNPIAIPKLWFDINQVDYISDFSAANFSQFARKHFGSVDFSPTPQNKSSNKGYEYYCQNNEISKANQDRILSSDFFGTYEVVKRKIAL